MKAQASTTAAAKSLPIRILIVFGFSFRQRLHHSGSGSLIGHQVIAFFRIAWASRRRIGHSFDVRLDRASCRRRWDNLCADRLGSG